MMPNPSPLGKFAIVFLLLLSPLYCHASLVSGKTYSVGVLNQQSVVATAELWNPLLAYLGTKTGARFAAPYAAGHEAKLHVLYRSPPFPQVPLSAHKMRVLPELAQRIRETLLDMPKDRDGKALLIRLGIPPFQPADDALYVGISKIYAQWRCQQAGATPQ